MSLRVIIVLAAVLAMGSGLAVAQPRFANLGAVLDAGGRKLSAKEFRQEVVGHPVAGSTPSRNDIEVVYRADGIIEGQLFRTVQGGAFGGAVTASLSGTWSSDDSERICTIMHLSSTALPPRCEYWFRVGNEFFLSPFDDDRETKVTLRALRR